MHKTRIQESVLSLLHPLTTYNGHNMHTIAILHICLDLGMNVHMLYYVERSCDKRDTRHTFTQRVTLLLKYGADVNSGEGALVRAAAWDDRLDTLLVLIEAGVDVNYCGIYIPAIDTAILSASHTVVEQLLLAGADIPENALQLAHYTQVDSALKVECITRRIHTRSQSS